MACSAASGPAPGLAPVVVQLNSQLPHPASTRAVPRIPLVVARVVQLVQHEREGDSPTKRVVDGWVQHQQPVRCHGEVELLVVRDVMCGEAIGRMASHAAGGVVA